VGVLLDVNVLLALAWPNHVHHEWAHQWFASRRGSQWATCPLTQLAFVRLSAQPVVVKTAITVADALRALVLNTSVPEHVFWPLEFGIADVSEEIRERLIGHHRLADAILLELAIRNKGRLATFDRRLESLLSPDSEHRAALEILSVE